MIASSTCRCTNSSNQSKTAAKCVGRTVFQALQHDKLLPLGLGPRFRERPEFITQITRQNQSIIETSGIWKHLCYICICANARVLSPRQRHVSDVTPASRPFQPQPSMTQDPDQVAAMPVGDILAVAGVLLLFMTFAFGVVYLQYCLVACHRRRRSAALASSSSSSQSAPRRGRDGDPESLLSTPAAAATVYRAAARSKEGEVECAVCLAGLEDGGETRFMPCCGHGFHAQCVGTWLAMASRPTCPLCRRINVARPPPGMAPAPASALPRVLPEPASYAAGLPASAYEQGARAS